MSEYLYTETPTYIQEDSTKNCPYCGYENGEYVRDIETEDNGTVELWRCKATIYVASQPCGRYWTRKRSE